MSEKNSNQTTEIKQQTKQAEIIKLQYKDYYEYEVGEHFISTILLAGLPFSGATQIIDSEKLPSSCNHYECSKLPAFKSEIIVKFPKSRHDTLQLSSTVASLSFTKGIKICFYNGNGISNSNSQLNQLSVIEDYMNTLTTEKGDRYYQYIKTIFIRYDFKTFQTKFDVYQSLLSNVNIEPERLQLLSEFSMRDYVYLPYSISFISKYPITTQVNDCIDSFINILFSEYEEANFHNDETQNKFVQKENEITEKKGFFKGISPFKKNVNLKKNEENEFSNKKNSKNLKMIGLYVNTKKEQVIIDFLKHLTYEIPYVPSFKSKLKLYLPFVSKPILIGGESERNEDDLPKSAFELSCLIENISIELLLIVFHLMLHEQKILFLSSSTMHLSKIIECLRELIYPMKWCNPLIPVLSEDLIKFLQCPSPFIMGLEEGLYFLAKEYLNTHEGIFIINLDKDEVVTSLTYKKVNKKVLKAYIGEYDVSYYEKLENSIEEIKQQRQIILKKDKKINEKAYDALIYKVFSTYLSGIFGDYQRYLTYLDDQAVFNIDSFLSNRNNQYENFYTEILKTQNFMNFIENNPKKAVFFNKICDRLYRIRKTNVNNKNRSLVLGLSIFNKKRLIEFNISDISDLLSYKSLNSFGNTNQNGGAHSNGNVNGNIQVQSGNNNNLLNIKSNHIQNGCGVSDSSKLSKDVSSNSNENSFETSEFLIPPFFYKSPIVDIEILEDCVNEYMKRK